MKLPDVDKGRFKLKTLTTTFKNIYRIKSTFIQRSSWEEIWTTKLDIDTGFFVSDTWNF